MTGNQVIERLRDRAPEIRRQFAIEDLSVFGSAARNDTTDASDVDVLVGFQGAADFDRFMGLKFYLEELLDTRVDLVTHKALRPAMRVEVHREAVRVA